MISLKSKKSIFGARKKITSGFTLLETVFYLALFAILFSGAITSAYSVMELSSRNQTKAMVQEEGDFLLAKIGWALKGAADVSASAAGKELTISKVSGFDAVTGQPVLKTIVFQLVGGNLLIDHPGAVPPETFFLNNSNVSINGLVFGNESDPGDGIIQENVVVSFTATAKTDTGSAYSQTFSSTIYLRK